MKIFLDDQGRDVRQGWVSEDWRRAINFEEFKTLIEEAHKTGEPIEAISFDNDLGEDENNSVLPDGYACAKWLVYESNLDLRELKFDVGSFCILLKAESKLFVCCICCDVS